MQTIQMPMKVQKLKKIVLALWVLFVMQGRLPAQNWLGYSVADGLSSNGISAMVEDAHGIIWVGTFAGLNRFDGRAWRTFSRAEGDSLVSDFVTALLVDGEGMLWIATTHGFSKVDPLADLNNPANWHNYNREKTAGGLVDDDIVSMLEDSRGNIWMATRNRGMSILRPAPGNGSDPILDRNNWTVVNSGDQLAGLEIFALANDGLGNTWVGTFDGVSRFRPQQHELTGKWDLFPELGDVRTIFADGHGFVWFGRAGAGPVRLLAADPSQRAEFFFPDDVDAMGEDRDGNIWLGTAEIGDGIFVARAQLPAGELADPANWFQFSQQNGLASNVITQIVRDSEGDMWVGTGQKGLSRLQVSWHNFSAGYGLDFTSVTTIAEDGRQRLWIGTDNKLRILPLEANFLLKKNWLAIRKMEKGISEDIRTLFRDDAGQFWIGATPERALDPKFGGLLRIDPHSVLSMVENWLRFTVDNTNGALASNLVNAIAQDGDRYLWFGTDNGLHRVHVDSTTADRVSFRTWSRFDTTHGLASNVIHALFYDSAGNALWVGTPAGLNRKQLDANLDAVWEEIEDFSGLGIQTIFQDLQGFLWIGTSGHGVYKSDVERSHWSRVVARQAREGLDENSAVTAIVQKRADEYWFATHGGLVRLRLTNSPAGIDSLWTRFRPEQGPGALGILSALVDSRGDLWFGTTGKGLTRHRIKTSPPDTRITSKIEATSSDRVLMTFEGIDLTTPPQALKYSYKIDLQDWSEFLPGEVVPIFGLSPGRHVFEVRAMDMDGNIDTTPDRDAFYVIQQRLGGEVTTGPGLPAARLYVPPGELGKDTDITITRMKRYELADSLSILGYRIVPAQGQFQFRKPATLTISFLNTRNDPPQQIGLFRQNETRKWVAMGGTVSITADTVILRAVITESGIYAVRNQRPGRVDGEFAAVNIQPRMFSPAGQGRGHGNRATISFTLQKDAMVDIQVYDLAGRLIRVLKKNARMLAGINAVDWDGRDHRGRVCRSGLYVVTIEADGRVRTKSVMVSNRFR